MGLGVSWLRFAFRVEGLWVRVVSVQNAWWESSAFLLLLTRV